MYVIGSVGDNSMGDWCGHDRVYNGSLKGVGEGKVCEDVVNVCEE